MGALLPLLATFAVLAGGSALVATVGSRRRARRRRLSTSERTRLEHTIGPGLLDLLDATLEVREQVEDTLARARELPGQPTGAGMRPLWRQIDDANLVHALVRVRDELLAWLRRFERLAADDRRLVDALDLQLAPIGALVLASSPGQPPDGELLLGREAGMRAMLGALERAAASLRSLERALLEYRVTGYR
jgi:hypothetical protein